MVSSKRCEATAISSTAPSKASWCLLVGSLKPLTLRTNCRAAARISSSVATTSAWRSVLILRHMTQRYDPGLIALVWGQLREGRRRKPGWIETGAPQHGVRQPVIPAFGDVAHRVGAGRHQLAKAQRGHRTVGEHRARLLGSSCYRRNAHKRKRPPALAPVPPAPCRLRA